MIRNWMERLSSSLTYDNMVAQHDKIIAAIAAHDIEKARLAMREHIESSSDQLTHALLAKKNKA